MGKKIFTLTAGRSGSGWLSKFIAANLGIETVHEPLGIDDFDVRMPSVKVMRSFNTRGLDPVVRGFWKRKLETLPQDSVYCETNHTLGKCGLIEVLAEQPDAEDYTIIVLKRNLAKQCASYVQRGDFANILMLWQWYLAPEYPNCMVVPHPFRKMGQVGVAIWYALEMDSREQYYQRVYGNRLRFVEVQLEDAVKMKGASKLLQALGHTRSPVLPPKYNANSMPRNEDLLTEIEAFLSNSGYDAEMVVDRYLSANRSLALEDSRLAS